MNRHIPILTAICLVSCLAAQAGGQSAPASNAWVYTIAEKYAIFPDVTYGVANNYTLKLDVWQKKDAKVPAPTLIYYHGGGWIFGDRTGATLQLLPYLEMGWNVINVEYRMAYASRAPAAVEDCRCALHWVVRNAKQYNVDTQRIVLTGHSAGGHLSLTVGMLPNGTGLDNNCYGDDVGADSKFSVAAIVNWFGISDVNDLIEGPNLKTYAVMWVGSQTDAAAIAKRVSPLTYVRPGVPPVFSIHGDHDSVVPYEHSVRLHQALTSAGVPNQLVTIKGGGHGQFTDTQLEEAYGKLRAFLHEHGLLP